MVLYDWSTTSYELLWHFLSGLQFARTPPVQDPAQYHLDKTLICLLEEGTNSESFPVPTYLFFKGNERLGRNDVKVAGQAGKGERKVRSSQNRLRSDRERVWNKLSCEQAVSRFLLAFFFVRNLSLDICSLWRLSCKSACIYFLDSSKVTKNLTPKHVYNFTI